MAIPMLAGRVYTADDLGAFHLPLRAFYARCLAAGDPFDWSPQMYCGFYLTGEGQLGGYHPLHFLLYRFLPLAVAFDLECLVNYPLLLVGTYWLLRRWRLPRDAALFGGMAFAFSGFTMLHFVHVNAVAVVAHLPWLLIAIDVFLRPKPVIAPNHKVFAGVAIALLTASQLLIGYPQYVWYSLIAEAGYALLVTRSRRAALSSLPPGPQPLPPSPSPLAPRPSPLIPWIALGFAIAAVQLLPTWEALGESSRQAADASFHNWGSLHPLNLTQFVAPYLFATRTVGRNTHEYGCYAGSVTLLLAVWCLFSAKHSRRMRPLVSGALVLVIVGLLIALGGYGPAANLGGWLPVMNRFRFPCRAIVLVHFGLAILAAIGFAKLVRSTNQNRAGLRAIWLLFGLSVALAALAPVLWEAEPHWPRSGPPSGPRVSDALLRWTGPLLIGSAGLLIGWSSRGIRRARAALILLAAVDLGAYGLSYAVYPQTTTLANFIAGGDPPRSSPSLRIAVDLSQPNQPAVHRGDRLLLSGWKFADGYAGLEPARRLDYRDAAALRVANVGSATDEFTLERELGFAPRIGDWLSIDNPLPRTKLFAVIKLSSDPAHDINRIPLESTALVEQPIALDSGPAGIVTILDDRPGKIRLRADAPAQRLLFVSESFHPGWKCWIAGRPQMVLRVDGDFLGCLCPRGTSEVRFEFQPESLGWGRFLSLCGLGLLGGIVLVAQLRRRTPRHAPPRPQR
ncbi:MAG TPA: hypothetical protein VHX65_09990 [Pirellulales bacterium]|nr:hypothetical protein [Pirellulales bacterium]